MKKIFLFDLMCGEGVYTDGGKGSPIIALETIKNHYFANNQLCPDLTIWFNDNGLSEIEKGLYKVDRVKKIASSLFIPSNVTIKYFQGDYDQVHERAVQESRNTPYAKSLFFIDPYGYKEISPSHIKHTLKDGDTEVLLFLPISHMYRFASSSLKSAFPGSMPLASFLNELFGGSHPVFNSAPDFIAQLKDKFRDYLANLAIYVDTFTIERDGSNVYCLFFFTSHIRGFEKMVEAKWKLDSQRGQGFTQNKNLALFNPIELSGYHSKLEKYIASATSRTNREIHLFGLQNGFLPKHSHQVIKEWLTTRANFKIMALDSGILRKSATYISDDKRLVAFRFE